MNIDPQERDMIKHTLGLDYKDEPFRNHYIADEGHHSWDTLQALISKGYMKEIEPTFPICGRLFVATAEGRDALKEE
jgi:hypothetical protein